jgi:phosphoribosylanthranilate isomerase/adenine/guanine phosphoribosyltransferase-like PRPP-binding protein
MRNGVKICGITTAEDALAAVAAGADALGFVMSASPRQVSAAEVRAIVDRLPPFVATVGVFVDEPLTRVQEASAAAGVSMVQLQGDESPDYCRAVGRPVIKGFKVGGLVDLRKVADYPVAACLFDTLVEGEAGGTGRRFDWGRLDGLVFPRPVIVAGGLTAETVGDLIHRLNPAMVDVSSGVAADARRKDPARMRAFVDAVRRARRDVAAGTDPLVDAFDDRPLIEIDGRQFLVNPLTEQVPATTATLLRSAAERCCDALDLDPELKLVGEEDKGGALLAAVSLLSGLPYGIARWYPSGLAGQVSVDFSCEYTSGGLYLNGVDAGDRVAIVDDLISTGGTLIGLIEAVRRAGAVVEQVVCVAEKVDYDGVGRVRAATGLDVRTLVRIAVDGPRSRVVGLGYGPASQAEELKVHA